MGRSGEYCMHIPTLYKKLCVCAFLGGEGLNISSTFQKTDDPSG